MQVVIILFFQYCLYVSSYISLCIQVTLILLPRMNHNNGNAKGSGGLGHEKGYEFFFFFGLGSTS